MRLPSRALVVVLIVLTAGCSGGARSAGPRDAAAAPAPSVSGLVVLRTVGGMRVVDLATGASVASAHSGIATPDFSNLVGTADNGALSIVDSRSGSSRQVAGRSGLVPRAVSDDGSLVALAAPDRTARRGYLAPGRTSSTIVVAGTTGGTTPRTYGLVGNYLPEAFSAEKTHLFLIEYLPPAAPDRYRVRQLDLASGVVHGVLGPRKVPLDEQMRGIGRMQVLNRELASLHTLYRTVGTTRAFVHTLELDDMWAHCTVLPEPIGAGGDATAIGLAPNGLIYAWDAATGVLATFNGQEVAVQRSVAIRGGSPFPSVAAGGSAAITVAKDWTVYASAGARLHEVDGGTMAEQASWTVGGNVTGLAVSPDGRRLLALTGDQLVVFDRTTRSELLRMPADDATAIAAVLPSAG
jgi:hypothetical protein